MVTLPFPLEFIKKQLRFFGRIEKICQPELQEIRGLDARLLILLPYFVRINIVMLSSSLVVMANYRYHVSLLMEKLWKLTKMPVF